ncbi:sulfotransferase family 2 domain-containing protein [Candidatus Halocynthiibacter alkanivorans]|uniref:sulfotransferase family 2 domain-containing protein n=1 Tax=Candidatus Halocynthiibacter alkanivorans TaxID=2267619 RepID=UPI000DF3875C|nr:sulfotransferase family 2 domain-containing protein [Candidatus Halocynthiibacter alkanivorans]
MISHKYKCIFIHIPKCAGSSIEAALGHHEMLGAGTQRGMQDHRTLGEIQPLSLNLREFDTRTELKRLRWRFKKHSNPANGLTVNSEQYRDYFKFTFVRNPWARSYSWYRNVMRDERKIARHGITADCTFKEYLHRFGGTGYLKPQLYWITDRRGRADLDFTGRFETLQQDFRAVCEHLGIPQIELPHIVSGGGSNYKEAYSPDMRECAARIFSEEIREYGYTFDD